MFQKVEFTSAGQTVRGKFYGADKANSASVPVVMYFHGYGTTRKSFGVLARRLVEKGIAAFAFNFRGCGDSDGKPGTQTISDAYEDALAAYDFLVRQPGIDLSRIGVLGSSLGGYLAATLSADRKIANLALSAPALYHDNMWDQSVKNLTRAKLNDFRQNGDLMTTKAIHAIQAFKGDLLVIRHDQDEQMPPALGEAYCHAANQARSRECIDIAGANHSHTFKTRQISHNATLEWFKAPSSMSKCTT